MKLPFAENAYIPQPKITKYLLNIEHLRGGKDKAIFFMRFGFSLDEWHIMEKSLLAHAQTYEVANTLETPEGVHYVIEGNLDTPDGRNPLIRTVWALDTDSQTPRFITAYPI